MYVFTNNWFDPHLPNFEKFLNQYSNQEYHILEIGSHEGKSTTWFIDNILNHDKSSITSIDPYLTSDTTTPVNEHTRNKFLSNISNSKYPNKLYQYVDLSMNVMPKLDKKYDLIYIDGSHLSLDVMYDAVNSWNLLKPDGILWFDDYGSMGNSTWSSPQQTINAFLKCLDPKDYELLFSGWQLAIRKKNVKCDV